MMMAAACGCRDAFAPGVGGVAFPIDAKAMK
jgi:hypothetical protein